MILWYTGEDGITCKILKWSKHVIAESLTDIIHIKDPKAPEVQDGSLMQNYV